MNIDKIYLLYYVHQYIIMYMGVILSTCRDQLALPGVVCRRSVRFGNHGAGVSNTAVHLIAARRAANAATGIGVPTAHRVVPVTIGNGAIPLMCVIKNMEVI